MEITLEKIETNEFKNLNMVFKDNNITGIYDEDNTNISEIISFLCNIKKGNEIVKKVTLVAEKDIDKQSFISMYFSNLKTILFG